MRRLLVLRHAKSSWKDHDQDDHDRPLNKRGKRDAPRIGRLLLAETLVPDLVFCSTARRARRTAELVTAACGFDGELALEQGLYLATVPQLIAHAQSCEGEELLLLVGHNPGMQELVGALTGNQVRMPTAALALIELEIDDWSELDPGTGRLVEFWCPKALPPE